MTISDRHYFSLVELMVVIVIMGLLIGIVVPKLQTDSHFHPSQWPVARNEVKIIQRKIDYLYLDTGKYPESHQDLLRGSDVEDWHGPYLAKSTDLLDRWGSIYRPWSEDDRFELMSCRPDRRAGGSYAEDDILGW